MEPVLGLEFADVYGPGCKGRKTLADSVCCFSESGSEDSCEENHNSDNKTKTKRGRPFEDKESVILKKGNMARPLYGVEKGIKFLRERYGYTAKDMREDMEKKEEVLSAVRIAINVGFCRTVNNLTNSWKSANRVATASKPTANMARMSGTIVSEMMQHVYLFPREIRERIMDREEIAEDEEDQDEEEQEETPLVDVTATAALIADREHSSSVEQPHMVPDEIILDDVGSLHPMFH